jgi:hypothetical protein
VQLKLSNVEEADHPRIYSKNFKGRSLIMAMKRLVRPSRISFVGNVVSHTLATQLYIYIRN